MRALETQYPYNALADSRQGGRPENQDTCAWGDTPYGFLVTVCDGMGGGPSGKTASATAANRLVQFVTEYDEPGADRVQLLADAVQAANTAVYEMAQENPAFKGMGTTATALLINEKSAIVAHVGDSRVYQFRGGRKVFRTWDHSQVFEKLKMGTFKTEEEARNAPGSNIILRAVGTCEHVKVDVVELPYEKGDRFMLCTDGIWGAFPEKEIIAMAAKTAVLSGAVESLVVRVDAEGAQNGGHHDNLTVALVETKIESKLKEEMSTKHNRILTALGVLCALSLLLNVILILTRPKKTEPQPQPQQTEASASYLARIDEMEHQIQIQQGLIESLKKESEEKNVSLTSFDEVKILRGELQELIRMVNELKAMKSGDKSAKVKSIQESFNNLRVDFGEYLDDATEKQLSEWFTNDIMKAYDSDNKYKKNQGVTGHYDGIIRAINSLLDALKNI